MNRTSTKETKTSPPTKETMVKMKTAMQKNLKSQDEKKKENWIRLLH